MMNSDYHRVILLLKPLRFYPKPDHRTERSHILRFIILGIQALPVVSYYLIKDFSEMDGAISKRLLTAGTTTAMIPGKAGDAEEAI